MYRIVGETVKEEELERLKNMLLIEESLYDEGYEYICGVDEAGRGPLCGPVVAAAVILPKHVCIEGVNDSKKISEKKREKLYDDIMNVAIAVGIGISDVDVIEKVNILNATKIAMKKAIESLSIKPDYVLIDGVRDHRCTELANRAAIQTRLVILRVRRL